MNPVIGARLITGAGSIIGGLIGSLSQKSANKTNLQIARETNQAQMEMQERANQFSAQMQQNQMDYASPANQRKMLEQAGFNPYLYQGVQAHASNSAAGQVGGALHAAQVQPVNAMAEALTNASINSANVVRNLAESRKANADATSTNIDNVTRAAVNEQNLKNLGLEGDAKALENEKNAALNPLIIEHQEKENENLDEQTALIRVQTGLARYDLNFMRPEQLKEVIENTKLAMEKQITEQEYRTYLDRMGKAGLTNAAASYLQSEVSRYLSRAQYEYYMSSADVNDMTAENIFQGLIPDEDLKWFKQNKMKGLYWDVLNKKMNFLEGFHRAQGLEKDVDFKDWAQGFQKFRDIMGLIKTISGMFFGNIPATPPNLVTGEGFR